MKVKFEFTLVEDTCIACPLCIYLPNYKKYACRGYSVECAKGINDGEYMGEFVERPDWCPLEIVEEDK